MKCYTYNDEFIYTGETICQYDELDKKYLLPRNATFIEIIQYNQELEYLFFDIKNQKWIKKNIKLKGEFYLKEDGTFLNEINKIDIKLYTKIKPQLEIRSDLDLKGKIIKTDTIKFNETLNIWEYVEVSNKTLNILKEQKKIELKNEYDLSKINLKFFYLKKEIIFLNNGVEDAITELNRRLVSNTTIGTDFAIEQIKILLKVAIEVRHKIRGNVEICKDEIDKLENIKDIENYIPSIQYKFDEIINVENYLK